MKEQTIKIFIQGPKVSMQRNKPKIASVEYTETPADKNSLNLTCYSKLDIKLV